MAIHRLHLHKPSIGPIRAFKLFCGWNSKLRPGRRLVVVQTPALVYTTIHRPNAKHIWTIANTQAKIMGKNKAKKIANPQSEIFLLETNSRLNSWE
jgi:hypothetical protein